MLEDGYITEEQAQTAMAEPITLATRSEKEIAADAEYFAEEVRRFWFPVMGKTLCTKADWSYARRSIPKCRNMRHKLCARD